MSAAQYDLTIEQGATWTLELVWKDETGTPIPLTGYTAKLWIKSAYSSTAEVQLSEASGISIDGPNGKLTATLTAAQTTALAAGAYVYDLKLTSPGGIATRLLEGDVEVKRQVAV